MAARSGRGEELQPMEISALRLETAPKNLTARVQIIDQSAIRKSGAFDLADLLRKEANLQVRSTSGNSARSEISMGGFGENGGQRTLVLLDGHRMNAIDLSQINWYSIPLSLVESIEVIRGGQSAVYGNHAVGGVIKINTRSPHPQPRGSLEASMGTFAASHFRASHSQAMGKTGLTVFGELSESDGYRANGDHQTDAGGMRLDWGSEPECRAYLSWTYSETDFGLPGALNAAALLADPRQSSNPFDRGRESSSHGRAGLSVEINDDWVFENRFGYLDRVVKVDMPSALWKADTAYESFSCGPLLRHQSEAADWMIGLDWMRDEVEADTNFDDSQLERDSAAFFAATRHSLAESWSWNGNLRLEASRNSGVYGGASLNPVKSEEWAWAIGLVRELGGSDRIYGAFRRFYRYPATDEILLAWPPPGALNTELKPESGHEVEIGMEWKLESLSLGGRIFRQWMDGEIIYDSSSWSNLNLEECGRLGVDLSLEWKMTDAIGAGIVYEFVRAKIEEGLYSGSRIPLVPDGLLRTFLEMRPGDSWGLRLGASYVGESFAGSDFSNSGLQSNDYWLCDLSADFQFSPRATLFGGVENLLDEDYLSTAFGSGYYPGEGRKARIGLRYSF